MNFISICFKCKKKLDLEGDNIAHHCANCQQAFCSNEGFISKKIDNGRFSIFFCFECIKRLLRGGDEKKAKAPIFIANNTGKNDDYLKKTFFSSLISSVT
jgi:uncharacterized protein YlaI